MKKYTLLRPWYFKSRFYLYQAPPQKASILIALNQIECTLRDSITVIQVSLWR